MEPNTEILLTSLLVFLGSILGSTLAVLFVLNSDEKTIEKIKEKIKISKKSSVFSPLHNKKVIEFLEEMKDEI